jgi:hypothetical protein
MLIQRSVPKLIGPRSERNTYSATWGKLVMTWILKQGMPLVLKRNSLHFHAGHINQYNL